jgi:hypothetical protein
MNHTNFLDHSVPSNQRRALSIYINQYNQVQNQIDYLYRVSDEIRDNINSIIFNETPRTNTFQAQRNVRNTRTRNSGLFTETTPIFYDYTRPVLPTTYESLNTTRRRTPSVSALYRERDTDYRNYLSSFFTNVDVRPTEAQIQQSTRNIRYGNIENPTNESCPILLERFQEDDVVTQIHYCGHLFNPDELTVWFQTNVRCPMCRYDIRNYVASSQNRDSSSSFANGEYESSSSSSSTTSLERSSVERTSNVAPSMTSVESTNEEQSNEDLIHAISERLLNLFNNTNLSSATSSNNDRILYDASNNVLLYETIITRRDRI